MIATAKLIEYDGDQVVLLPEEFQFENSEVRISKVGDKVVIELVTNEANSPLDK